MKEVKNNEQTIITYPINNKTRIIPVYYSIHKLGSDTFEKEGVLSYTGIDCFTRSVGITLSENEITNGIHRIKYFDSNQEETFAGIILVTENTDESRNYIVKT